jgi:ABC-type multidrug transport system ATPase subunit
MRRVARLRGATVLLGRFPALARADFDAFEGEVVVLEGPNGSGKTTLLRLLVGLVVASEGEVSVFGRDPAQEAASIRRAATYLGHESALYEDLSGSQNIAFLGRLGVVDPDRARAIGEELGVGPRELRRRVRDLSAGQRKKVGLAIALARPAELVLLDEPHASLDAEGKTRLDALLVASARGGRTVVLASHETGRVRSVADRRYRIVAGHPAEVPAC